MDLNKFQLVSCFNKQSDLSLQIEVNFSSIAYHLFAAVLNTASLFIPLDNLFNTIVYIVQLYLRIAYIYEKFYSK